MAACAKILRLALLLGSFRAVACIGTLVPQVEVHFRTATSDLAPTGQIVPINGVNTYVSLPDGPFDNSTAVLMLTDVFGLPSIDNLLLADNWANAGFATFAPDYLNGDAFPSDGSVDLNTWLVNHGRDQTIPPMLTVIEFLRSTGVTKLATTGYCFGGLYTTLLSQNNTIQVATMAHPSLLTVPDDFEIIKAVSDVPIQIQNAELDTGLTPALAEEVDGVLGNGQYLPGYNRTEWFGVGHGFAVSANASDPVQVAAKEGAFQSSLNWITSHLNA